MSSRQSDVCSDVSEYHLIYDQFTSDLPRYPCNPSGQRTGGNPAGEPLLRNYRGSCNPGARLLCDMASLVENRFKEPRMQEL